MADNKRGPGGASGTGKVPPRPGGRPGPGGRSSGRPNGTYTPAYTPRPGYTAPRGTARQLAQRRRRNIYIVSGTTAVVIVVIGAIVVFSVAGNGGGGGTTATTSRHSHKTTTTVGATAQGPPGTFAITPAQQEKVEDVALSALVSASTSKPHGITLPRALPASAPALSVDGHPEILFLGAEWCPYCAAERWALLMALSKFGTFGPLRGTTSDADDIYGSTPTFSFYHATYTSKYLFFVPVEEQTALQTPLQAPTAAQTALFSKFDAPPYVNEQDAGDIPFIYFVGKYWVLGAQYSPSAIAGMAFTKAVPYMTSGTNSTSKAAEASAGYLVGDICALTHDQPASVCSHVPAHLIGATG